MLITGSMDEGTKRQIYEEVLDYVCPCSKTPITTYEDKEVRRLTNLFVQILNKISEPEEVKK